MPLTDLVLYILCLLIFILYIWHKYKKRAYIFSSFNINFFIYTFSIFISPIFWLSDQSWTALGIKSASSMFIYMNKSLAINAIGFIIYIISLYISEFQIGKFNRIIHFSKRISASITPVVIDVFFVISIIAWYIVTIRYCGGMPLLTGNRTFYYNTAISPIYLFLNETILIFTFYYIIRVAQSHKKYLYIFLGIFTVAMQGNRGSLITSLLFPGFVLILYFRQINNEKKKAYGVFQKGLRRKIIRELSVGALVLLIFGLALVFIRRRSLNFDLIGELLYGNTFSDLRDGAYILKGFVENTNSTFLYGKTYLAGLISFIPSSLSKFRNTWSWGRYTTSGLFGWSNHFGLRGGNSMEAYVNFGWIGVILISVMQGYLYGLLEKIFYKIFIRGDIQIEGKEYFVFSFISGIASTLICTSSMYNLYVLLAVVCTMMVLSSLLRSRYS